MQPHRLDPESLQVQSFTPEPAAQPLAIMTTPLISAAICRSDFISCFGSCQRTCDTCAYPCPVDNSIDGNVCV